MRRTLTGETGHRRVRALRAAVPPVPWREAPGSRPGSQTSELGSMAAQLGLPSHPDLTQERPGRQVGGSHASTQPEVTGVKCRAFMGLTDRVT